MPWSSAAAATSEEMPSGTRHEPVARARDLLGVAAGNADPRDPLAGVVDPAGALDADDRRRRGAVAAALALVHVAVVDADRLDVDQHLAVTRLGRRPLVQLENLGATVSLEHDRAHAGGGTLPQDDFGPLRSVGQRRRQFRRVHQAAPQAGHRPHTTSWAWSGTNPVAPARASTSSGAAVPSRSAIAPHRRHTVWACGSTRESNTTAPLPGAYAADQPERPRAARASSRPWAARCRAARRRRGPAPARRSCAGIASTQRAVDHDPLRRDPQMPVAELADQVAGRCPRLPDHVVTS